MIIGTAGHIDHGKTALVSALTGVDTDRLPEEKARGISIELGYAYLALTDGGVLGFVDVPGHERFIHTMLAGATGIDFALLVVAADDGVMPQTREHVDILALLGIEAGAVAITKIDTVEESRVRAVERDVCQLLAPTLLAGAETFPVSSRTGSGIEPLRRHLEERALTHRRSSDDAHFRLAVDRSFTLPGIGTIVTGTVHSGEVRVDDRMVVAPAGRDVRIRSIHAQNRESDRGTVGQRCALNLAGMARDEVARGDWIVDPAIALATERLDARMTVLADVPKGVRSGATVHVHIGAAHISGRVVVLDGGTGDGLERDEMAPGANRLAQLVLQGSIAAWHGDRFIVRDASAMRTLGGGRVLDPFAPARYRCSADRLAVLRALEAPTATEQLSALLALAPCGVDLRRFARAGNARGLDRVLRPEGARRITGGDIDFAVGSEHWRALEADAMGALAAFHHENPDESGPDGARLKRIAFPRLADAVYRALVAELVAAGKVRQAGPWLHLPDHSNAPGAQERTLLEKILPRLLDGRFDPPWVRDLAKGIAHPEALVRTAMIRASKRGEVFQVVRDLFYHPAAVRDLAGLANRIQAAEGDVRVAVFRDRTGLGRKRAIQILEFFDRVGYTRRVQDRRIVRTDSLLAPDASSIAARQARDQAIHAQQTA